MNIRIVTLVALVACAACSPAPAPTASAAPEPRRDPPIESVGFVNRVWVVAESPQVEVGALRVFLSDGTLVMASRNSKPALGSWSQDESGRLTITEEGRPYDTDVVELTGNVFRIRMHSPGEPVEMLLKPAPSETPVLPIDAKGSTP